MSLASGNVNGGLESLLLAPGYVTRRPAVNTMPGAHLSATSGSVGHKSWRVLPLVG